MHTFIVRTFLPGRSDFSPRPHIVQASTEFAAKATAIDSHRGIVGSSFTVMVAFCAPAPEPEANESHSDYQRRLITLAATGNRQAVSV